MLDPLDKRQRACPNWRVVEVKELSRVRRRPRPLKQLDQRARIARLALEAEIYRDPVATFSIRVTPANCSRSKMSAAHRRLWQRPEPMRADPDVAQRGVDVPPVDASDAAAVERRTVRRSRLTGLTFRTLPPPASFFKHLQMFFKHLQIMRSGVLDPLDKRQRACPNWRVVEVKELSRVRRRPRPLKQLDQRARIARLALEAEIYRDPVATFSIRVTPAQLQRDRR